MSISIHQMRIPTNYFSSVMLRPKREGNPKCYDFKDPEKTTECRDMIPNPSKDRAMHEEGIPLF
jgi:hypothetical protein